MGRVRTKLIKRAARIMIEKYFAKSVPPTRTAARLR